MGLSFTFLQEFLMKKILVPSLIAAAIASLTSVAHAAEPESTLGFNAGAVTEYRYRGISQSRLQPAVQGGVDYADKSGFYVGAWGSSIKWIKDAGKIANVSTKGNVEIDIYAGKRGEITSEVTYDVGVLQYWYPGNTLDKITATNVSADTTELYGQIGYGPAFLKYSHAVTDLFGNKNSDGSYYIDGSVNYPVAEGTVLNLHVGYQKVKNTANADYTDWKVGVTKDFGFVTGAIAIIGTDANKAFYVSPGGSNTGKTTAVVSLTKAF